MKVGRGREGKVEQGSGGSGRHHTASRAISPAGPSFGSSMEDIAEELEVRSLLERLDAAAAKLSVFPAERQLLEYKSILRDLLARAMKGFSLRRDLKWRRTDRSTYVTIDKAEAAVAELEEVFSKESDRTR
ncbi:MAG: hypothetical protein LBT15_01360, partial [Synergistaceae bacterium]|nr:hypothetical protein [Synergistaceae bacterium]